MTAATPTESPGAAPEQARCTILVVSYTHGRYLEQCLDSIVAQTRPCEIVVVDDASPDDSASVTRQTLQRHGVEASVVVHETNQGLGRSLRDGLARVRTEFVAYIAGDDWMEPSRVERQLSRMDELGERCGLVYSDCYRADEHGNRFDQLFSETHAEVWAPDVDDVFGTLLTRNWIPAPTILLRTSALRSVGGYDPELFYEDHDICLRMARAFGIGFCPEPLATHRELDTALGWRFWNEPVTWRMTRVRFYRKHLDLDAEYDGLVSRTIRTDARAVYLLGGDPRWVRATLGLVKDRRPHDVGLRLLLLAASLRVPGRWLGRTLALRAAATRALGNR
jgi:glycosyltransferase involved in cell wall biosynthesis